MNKFHIVCLNCGGSEIEIDCTFNEEIVFKCKDCDEEEKQDAPVNS